jgi:hypothetical protein
MDFTLWSLNCYWATVILRGLYEAVVAPLLKKTPRANKPPAAVLRDLKQRS